MMKCVGVLFLQTVSATACAYVQPSGNAPCYNPDTDQGGSPNACRNGYVNSQSPHFPLVSDGGSRLAIFRTSDGDDVDHLTKCQQKCDETANCAYVIYKNYQGHECLLYDKDVQGVTPWNNVLHNFKKVDPNCNNLAVSAGDPHILRFDGTAFDIDTTGTYSLFNVAGGAQFSVKSKVAHEARVAKGKFNMECEFGGSWLGGHNVTAVAAGVEAGMEAGIYFDGLFVSISELLQNASQYTWEITGHSKMILEICQIASHKSDYCISALSLRRKNKGQHAFMTMVTDVANITVRYNSIHFAGHLDIYTTLQQNADSTQIGGLLAGGRQGTRRGDSPLLASSVGAVGDVGIEG